MTSLIDKKVRLKTPFSPKGLGFLQKIQDRSDLHLSKSQSNELKAQGGLILRQPTEVLILAKGRVGNLLQWSEALGISYSTLAGRLRSGHCIDRILSPYHASRKGHHLLSDKDRAKCSCLACYMYFRRKKLGLNSSATGSESNSLGDLSQAPLGVAEPHLWMRIDSRTYAFKIGKMFKTIEQWSAILDIPEATLRARLTVYGKPIREAIVKEKPLDHGQRSTYLYHKCRCDACRRANTDYHRGLAQATVKRKMSR